MSRRTRKQLHFDTQRNARSLRMKRFAAAFSCFFVLLGGISLLLMLKYYDFDLSNISKPVESTENTTVEQTTVELPKVSGTHSYLWLCTEDGGNTVRFACIFTADMDSTVLTLRPLNPAATLQTNGFSGNFAAQLSNGGEKQLVQALKSTYGIEIEKYLRSTDSGFKKIINHFGGLETVVPEQINLRSESLTAIIGAGKQTMTGDTLLKYIRCYEGNHTKQAEIIAELIEKKMTATYFEKADSTYTKIINNATSDISVLDFAEIKKGIQKLIGSGKIEVNVTV